MNTCSCADYQHLSLDSASIYRRLAQTRFFLTNLQLIAEHQDGKSKLFHCPVCSQYWQLGKAWLWNNVEYAFKIPEILSEEWLKEPYLSPEEMTLGNDAWQKYLKEQNYYELEIECNTAGCTKRAVNLSVKCLRHHFEWLGRNGDLLEKKNKRIFPPYEYNAETYSFHIV